MKSAIVYVPMSADIVHPGHIYLLEQAQKYGRIVVGLLSDDAIKMKKGKPPVMSFAERREVVSHLKSVYKVIEQESPDYRPNLNKLRPNYVVHGNDWSEAVKDSVVQTINEWHGKLIETDYDSKPTTSSAIKQRILNQSMQNIRGISSR